MLICISGYFEWKSFELIVQFELIWVIFITLFIIKAANGTIKVHGYYLT